MTELTICNLLWLVVTLRGRPERACPNFFEKTLAKPIWFGKVNERKEIKYSLATAFVFVKDGIFYQIQFGPVVEIMKCIEGSSRL